MVIAALQSLGGNSRTPNRSDGETQVAAHNEDSGVGQGQGQLREQIILEQFKLAQLKQLQEIQQQIFQQQMALLNSGTASLESQPRDQTQRGFHGLPTPGSSTEIRPSQPIPVEFVSPMLLNYNDMDSNSVMSLEMSGQNPYSRNNSASHTPVFSPHDPVGTASAPAHIAFGNPYHSSQNGMNMHGSINALNMSSEPSSPLHSELDFDVSPLTSPWLGAKMTGNGTGSNGRVQPYGHHHQNQTQNRNQNQMLPHPTTHAGMKRAASPSTADIDSSRAPGSGSRSMNSTPLLRGTDPNANSRTRKGSVISSSPLAMAMGQAGMSGISGFPRMPSPAVDSSSSGSSSKGGTNRNNHSDSTPGVNGDNSNMGFAIVGDSPSPVDLSLSMPPPAAPASAFGATGTSSGSKLPESLVPVTPASIMNLGNSSISAAATSSTTTIVPVKERKTSHKAAEQKRRDSLKTTFDDLRGLLPPIPLPTDGDSKSGGAAAVDDETGIGFMALAKASLLPGALPPRGPPKAGEGPNKGVSKLQLLVCGNEYIRVLKGRVDRRDEEVEKLRREVRRLRSKLEESGLAEVKEDGGGGGGGRDGNEKQDEFLYKYGEMLDLDRDLDAVEVLESMRISSSGLSPSLSGGGSLPGVDEDEED
ncbi:hypothetical protein GGU11DRAFT_689221 [Lentinula aff. detonsa]|nr:hypothetical protein GGU11DRAFT_689221 [Lentinula aff. detonsa]